MLSGMTLEPIPTYSNPLKTTQSCIRSNQDFLRNKRVKKMKTLNTIEDAIARKIDDSTRDVFLSEDFQDIASDSQVIGRSLNELENKGKIIAMGENLYAKAVISPLSKRIVPRKALRELATEFLGYLNIEVVPSSYDKAYNEGRTTQVPTGRVIGVKKPVDLNFGYDGKFVTFEYVA